MKIKDNMSQSYLKGLKNFDKETTMWIVRNSRPQVVSIILMCVFYALLSYAGVFVAGLAKEIVDAAAVYRDMGRVVFFAVLIISVTIGQILFNILSRITSFNASNKLQIHIKGNLFSTMIKKDYASVTSYHTGELLNRLTSDVDVITSAIIGILPSLVYFIVKLVGILVVLFSIDWRFAIVFVIGGALVMLVMLMFKGTLKNLHKKSQESDGKTRSFMQESLSSLLVIKVFNKYPDKI